MTKNPNKVTALSFVTNFMGDATKICGSSKSIGSMASTRIQLVPAINACKNIGMDVSVLSLHSEQIDDFFKIEKSKVCLVGKMSSNNISSMQSMIVANLAAVSRFKNMGSQIVVQTCDNPFASNGILKDFHIDLYAMADHIVFPCTALKELCESYIKQGTSSHVIPDPWQLINSHKPRNLNSSDKINIIWFGSNKNIVYLHNLIPSFLRDISFSQKIELSILGSEKSLRHIVNLHSKIKGEYPNWSFRLVKWNPLDQPRQLENEITRAHISLLPSDNNDPLKLGVSHNRLVDSLRGGCITVASKMKSYEDLSDIAIVEDDIVEGLRKAINNYDHYKHTMNRLMPKRLVTFDPKQNISKWEYLMRKIVE